MAGLTKSEAAAANIRNTFNGIKKSISNLSKLSKLTPKKTITKPQPQHQGWKSGEKIRWGVGGRRKSNRGKKHKSKQMKSRRSRR
jgi:hypothetical protein